MQDFSSRDNGSLQECFQTIVAFIVFVSSFPTFMSDISYPLAINKSVYNSS